MKNLRIVFMGTPDFAVPGLDTIYKNFGISGCFTQPSRPSGRGQKIIDSSIKKYCLLASQLFKCKINQVFVSSTGVIGEHLNFQTIWPSQHRDQLI